MRKFVVITGCAVLAGFTSCSLPDFKAKIDGAEYCEDPPDKYRGAYIVTCVKPPDLDGGLCCAYGFEDEKRDMCFHVLCAQECGSFQYVKTECVPAPPAPEEDRGI